MVLAPASLGGRGGDGDPGPHDTDIDEVEKLHGKTVGEGESADINKQQFGYGGANADMYQLSPGRDTIRSFCA